MMSYRQLSKMYKREDIEDMVKFGILDVVERGAIITSFKFKLNTNYPVSDLILKKQEKSDIKLANEIQNEWNKTN